MAKTHNLAYDYSAYDEQELANVRKIKHRKNAVVKNKRKELIKFISLPLIVLAMMC